MHEISREMEEPIETIRALRRVAASELSLDAPIDRSDGNSASFGERFAGVEATEIEADVEALPLEYLQAVAGDTLIGHWQELFERLKYHDLGTEAAPYTAKFQPDYAGANDPVLRRVNPAIPRYPHE